MNRRRIGYSFIFISMFFMVGCWNRVELNNQAIIVGWGLDINKDNRNYIATAQYVLPSNVRSSQGGGGQGGSNKAFSSTSSLGKNIMDASQNMQAKLSRHIFAGHRQNIFIGEKLAKHGLEKVLDEYSRNPDVPLRSDIWVVKGEDAQKLLKVPNSLEGIPALAILKANKNLGGAVGMSLLEFLRAASSETSSPTLPVVQVVDQTFSTEDEAQNPGSTNKTVSFAGRAIFNKKLKFVGYINMTEALDRFWVLGKKKFYTLEAFVPEGSGNVSLDAQQLKSKIKTTISDGNKVSIDVHLSGEGLIRENNTNLDLKQSRNLPLLENALDKHIEKRILQMIKKVQKQYGADIFTFDEMVHQQHPNEWKTLKKSWDKVFPEANVSVSVRLTIKRVGLTGPSLQLRKQEIHSGSQH